MWEDVIYKKMFEDRPGIIGQTYKLFSAEFKSKKVRISKEHSTYKWVDYKKALKTLTWQNQRKCLRQVNKTLIKTRNVKN